MWEQFTDYCGKALTGDLGTSYQFRAPVIDKITEALPNTLLLTGTSFVLYTALGIFLGTRSAWRNGAARRPAQHRSGADPLLHPVVLARAAADHRLLGGHRARSPVCSRPAAWSRAARSGFAYVLDVAHHLVLPVVTLVAVEYGQTLLVTRSALLDEMGSDYLTTARAKGLRDDLVRRRHAVPERAAADGDADLHQPRPDRGRA